MTLQTYLKSKLDERGLSKTDLAKEMGLQAYRYLGGQTKGVSPLTAKRLAIFFDAPIDEVEPFIRRRNGRAPHTRRRKKRVRKGTMMKPAPNGMGGIALPEALGFGEPKGISVDLTDRVIILHF